MSLGQTSATGIQKLSPEVLDLIFDALADEKRGEEHEIIPALTACRLVSRSFSSFATPRAFKTAKLHCFGWKYREHNSGERAAHNHARKFLRLLEANPALAKWVRVLDLTSRMGQSSWIGTSKTLHLILPKLVNMQHLIIDVYNGGLFWGARMKRDLANAFLAAFQLPSLKTLKVMNVVHFPLDTFFPLKKGTTTTGSTSLESLTLCAYTLQNLSRFSLPEHPTVCTIKKLRLSYKCYNSYSSSQNWTDMEPSWLKLAAKLSDTLKELEIFNAGSLSSDQLTEKWPSGDSLSILKNLESLTLLCAPKSAHGTFDIPFPPGFAKALESSTPMPSVKSLCLTFSVSWVISTYPMWQLTEGWDALPDLLCSMFPQLSSLVLRFQMSNFIGGGKSTKTPEEMKEHFCEVLSGIKKTCPALPVKVLVLQECEFMV
ncbi:hypothetical protein CVT24_000264 [Panaeolus cyanescens]|uniref:F-box domain-containing protein n=1 Tax=Panaeolus cyanescens TaxID=181874 RepID=A0A409YD65_9AGAR|nr:hypothetical protein CVT24_000264 [Panaeolus cyanescens]